MPPHCGGKDSASASQSRAPSPSTTRKPLTRNGPWMPAATASPTGTEPSAPDSTPPVPVADGVSSQPVDALEAAAGGAARGRRRCRRGSSARSSLRPRVARRPPRVGGPPPAGWRVSPARGQREGEQRSAEAGRAGRRHGPLTHAGRPPVPPPVAAGRGAHRCRADRTSSTTTAMLCGTVSAQMTASSPPSSVAAGDREHPRADQDAHRGRHPGPRGGQRPRPADGRRAAARARRPGRAGPGPAGPGGAASASTRSTRRRRSAGRPGPPARSAP